jgi:hypothetical protein
LGCSLGGSGGGVNAVNKDIAALVNALNAAGGGANIVFVPSPAQAVSLKAYVGPKFDFPILASAALANGTVLAIDAGSFVSGISPIPEFGVSNAAVVHEVDVSPQQIGESGTASFPARSGFQTRTLALRMITRISWLMRAVGHVQRVTAVTW